MKDNKQFKDFFVKFYVKHGFIHSEKEALEFFQAGQQAGMEKAKADLKASEEREKVLAESRKEDCIAFEGFITFRAPKNYLKHARWTLKLLSIDVWSQILTLFMLKTAKYKG